MRIVIAALAFLLGLSCSALAQQAQPVVIVPSVGSGVGIAPVASAAVESSHILKSTPGNLYSMAVSFGTCASTPCWILLLDSATVPADGTVAPVKWFQVATANTTTVVSWLSGPPVKFANGIVAVCSTTGPFTKTATAQCGFSAEVQ